MSLSDLETVFSGEAKSATNDASSYLDCQKDDLLPEEVTSKLLHKRQEGNEDEDAKVGTVQFCFFHPNPFSTVMRRYGWMEPPKDTKFEWSKVEKDAIAKKDSHLWCWQRVFGMMVGC